RQHRAAADLEALGVSILRKESAPKWLQPLLGNDELNEVTEVYAAHHHHLGWRRLSELRGADLQRLRSFASLEELVLTSHAGAQDDMEPNSTRFKFSIVATWPS